MWIRWVASWRVWPFTGCSLYFIFIFINWNLQWSDSLYLFYKMRRLIFNLDPIFSCFCVLVTNEGKQFYKLVQCWAAGLQPAAVKMACGRSWTVYTPTESVCFCHWPAQTVILIVWQHYGKVSYREPPYSIYRNNNFIFVKNTSLQNWQKNTNKTCKTVWVHLPTAPTMTNSGLLEINL